MNDALTIALQGLEGLDPDETARLLAAFAAIADPARRADVIRLAETLGKRPHLN